MGIIQDLRKKVEKLERKVKAAERIMNLWKEKAHEQKSIAEMEELIMTAMVLKAGGEIKLTGEDVGSATKYHLDGEFRDTVLGREYYYRARPDNEEKQAAGVKTEK